ncbi:GAF domain-containing protein [Luedemannella flava]
MQLSSVDRSSVLNPLLIKRGVRSILGVPMIAAGQLLGVLHVGSLTPRGFTADEVRLLQVAAEGSRSPPVHGCRSSTGPRPWRCSARCCRPGTSP